MLSRDVAWMYLQVLCSKDEYNGSRTTWRGKPYIKLEERFQKLDCASAMECPEEEMGRADKKRVRECRLS